MENRNIQGVSKFANSEFRAWYGRTQWSSKNTYKKKFALPEEDISTLIFFTT
jgi:hypothetical protein